MFLWYWPNVLFWLDCHGDSNEYIITERRNDTQHNDIQYNDTQHNDTQHNATQHNDTQHYDTQHIDLICDTQYYDTKHNGYKVASDVIQSVIMLSIAFFIFMLSVVMLSVVAPTEKPRELHSSSLLLSNFRFFISLLYQ